MDRIIGNKWVTVSSPKCMAAMTQELESGVECNVQYLVISLRPGEDYHHIDDFFRALMNKPTLQTLDINTTTCISLGNTTTCPYLSNLFDPNINPLGRLREFELRGTLTDEHVVEICKGLSRNNCLVALTLCGIDKIGVFSGFKSLRKIIATNHSLISLNLACNKFNVAAAGSEAIAEGIMQRQYPSHSTIARHFSTQPYKELKLNLGQNGKMDFVGVKAFASLLHKQHSALSPLVTLTHLSLSLSMIGDEGAVAIAETLKSFNTDAGLIHLNLEYSQIGDAGAIAFASALKENKVLTYLNLKCNKIQLDGGLALCRTMEEYNDTLDTFNLERNPCGDEKWKTYGVEIWKNVTIGEYSNKTLSIRKKSQNDVSTKKRKYCQLVKANYIFHFLSF